MVHACIRICTSTDTHVYHIGGRRCYTRAYSHVRYVSADGRSYNEILIQKTTIKKKKKYQWLLNPPPNLVDIRGLSIIFPQHVPWTSRRTGSSLRVWNVGVNLGPRLVCIYILQSDIIQNYNVRVTDLFKFLYLLIFFKYRFYNVSILVLSLKIKNHNLGIA